MDSDFWTARLAAAKRQFNLQHHNLHGSSHLDRLNMDDFEVEDEVRPDIPCPYCYEDFDIASLCAHLEDEHSCESRATRRRRLRRVAIPSSQALSLLGRDLREAHLQVLLGGGGFRSGSNAPASTAATDPFLSSLVMNFSGPEVDDFSKTIASSVEDTTFKSTLTKHHRKPSFDSSLTYEERQKKIQEAAERADFVQDLLLCTVLGD
ncbi:hypothetical protein KSS87_014598 [Heliosperma pusillum]|nr:hypothetical protein KSS87_014598 [Heliosperma pusillum]